MPVQKRSNAKRLVFTVTNELNYDQRMIRICSSLQKRGYQVTLIGRSWAKCPALQNQSFSQKRLFCFFKTGKLFYIEYNIKLFLHLLFKRMDLICAVDLDTIIPCFFISLLRNKKRVYDAHELFCEMKEVVSRPSIHSFWKFVERRTLPKFKNGYTVNHSISSIYNKEYRVHYQVIRNVPYLVETTLQSEKERFIIYQGAVNEGRSFETLIPAFKYIDYPLFVYGDGNFFDKAVELVNRYGLQDKVIFKGKLLPSELKKITPKALLGVALVENNGLNSYYSLANRFFDYIHACVPQVCVNYPEYSYINQQYKVAMLIDDLSPESIATAVNSLIRDTQLYETMTRNCQAARQVYNWQKEEVKLIDFYKSIIPID